MKVSFVVLAPAFSYLTSYGQSVLYSNNWSSYFYQLYLGMVRQVFFLLIVIVDFYPFGQDKRCIVFCIITHKTGKTRNILRNSIPNFKTPLTFINPSIHADLVVVITPWSIEHKLKILLSFNLKTKSS